MPNCPTITGQGTICNRTPKENGRCGIHKTENVHKEIQYIVRRGRFIRSIDVMGRISVQISSWLWLPLTPADTVDTLMVRIVEMEDLIRGDYPGYNGSFTADNRSRIEMHGGNYRVLAERLLPLHLRHQLPLLHEWYEHFHRLLVGNGFAEYTIDDMYNRIIVINQIRPRLAMQWVFYNVNVKMAFVRVFTNMSILGQRHVGDMRFILGVPPADIPAVAAVAAFVADNQNVHRKDTVDYVKDIFEKLMMIPVPITQKTLGTIFSNCLIAPQAAQLLVKMYTEPTSIYEIPLAYPKALDAVCAYIESSSNKIELYKRIAEELTDNIGMCAQGNLSRLCNILSGYVDGISPPVAQGELLQNRMSAIAGDADGDKVERAKIALRELHIDEGQWAPWIEAFEE